MSYGDGPQLKVLTGRLLKLGIEPANPCLQGQWFICYITAAPLIDKRPYYINMTDPWRPFWGYFIFGLVFDLSPVNSHGHVEAVS